MGPEFGEGPVPSRLQQLRLCRVTPGVFLSRNRSLIHGGPSSLFLKFSIKCHSKDYPVSRTIVSMQTRTSYFKPEARVDKSALLFPALEQAPFSRRNRGAHHCTPQQRPTLMGMCSRRLKRAQSSGSQLRDYSVM